MAPIFSGFGLFLKVSSLTHPPGMVDIEESVSHAIVPSRYGGPFITGGELGVTR